MIFLILKFISVLNAWSGVFIMIFLGMSSSRFRAGLFGNGSVGGSPLFKYMADSKKRRRHAMAFGAFFGDGTGSGLSSRSVSNESLPSGPDSLGTFHMLRNTFLGGGG